MDVTVDIAVGKERYGDNSSHKKDIDMGSEKHRINGNDHVNGNGKDETNIKYFRSMSSVSTCLTFIEA